jgi:hypothetical protein
MSIPKSILKRPSAGFPNDKPKTSSSTSHAGPSKQASKLRQTVAVGKQPKRSERVEEVADDEDEDVDDDMDVQDREDGDSEQGDDDNDAADDLDTDEEIQRQKADKTGSKPSSELILSYHDQS